MKPGRLGTLLGVTVAACSDAPARDPGAAVDPLAGGYCVAGVRAIPGTVHFTGLPWLLNAAESMGPISLVLNVGVLVQPTMVSTVTGVKAKDVTPAVGYSFLQRHDLIAVSTSTLESGERSRIEAYTAFEESTWEVRDAACGTVLGTGASFDPSGVFFQTVPACHGVLPDVGLFGFVAGCEDLACAPVPGSGEPSDAGPSPGAAPEHEVPAFVPTDINPLLRGPGGRR